MIFWKALLVAASLSTIAAIPHFPANVSTPRLIAQAKQPSIAPLRTLSGHGGIIRAIAISTNGQILVSGGDTDTINLWDFPAGNITASFTGHTGNVTAVAISPDAKTVVSASEDKTVKLWDIKTQELRRTLTGHLGAVRTVAISPDGKTIISGSDDGTIKLWDLQTGKLIRTITSDRKPIRAINSLTISRDGKLLVSGNGSGKIKLWMPTGKLIRTLAGHSESVWSIAISPNGQTIASTSTDNTTFLTVPPDEGAANIKLWNAKTGKLIRSFSGHVADVRAIAISPNGQMFATGGGFSQEVSLWDLKTGNLLNTFTGHKGGIYGLTFSPDGKTVISGSADGTIKVWQVGAKVKSQKLKVKSQKCTSMCES